MFYDPENVYGRIVFFMTPIIELNKVVNYVGEGCECYVCGATW